ncbi:MAG TPA: hypothetical protein VIF09_04735, partial [Polyangiaceae bacterium]
RPATSATAPPGPPVVVTSAAAPPSVTPSSIPAVVRPPPPVLPPRVVDRTVSLDLIPPMGVRVTIDGSETRKVASGDALRLDSKAHTLAFTCDVCTVVERSVAASDKDETVSVRVPIKPATLVINGPPDKAYQIEGRPEVGLHVGSNSVPIANNGSFETVTVKLVGSDKKAPVRLEAGKSATADFRDVAPP